MDEEDFGTRFEAAPASGLNDGVKMGRPRDTRYDDVVRKAYDESVAQRAVVPETQVEDVIRGLKRGAKHLSGVSISYTARISEYDETKWVIEFVAYPTHRREGNTD